MQRNCGYSLIPTFPRGGANAGHETGHQIPKCNDDDGRKGETALEQEGPTRIPHMAGVERERSENNPTTTARTATGIQQGTVRRTPETRKSGPYGGRVGYRTVEGPDKYWQSNNHEIHGSDQQNTGK